MEIESPFNTLSGERVAALPLDLSYQHLQAELARIDVFIRREVWRWQLAGQDPNDTFRGMYLSDEDAETLLSFPLGTSWGQSVGLDPSETALLAEAEEQAAEQVQLIEAAAQTQGQPLRLSQLATIFGLDRFAVDALLICLAPALDLRYEQLYGYLQDNLNRKRPSVNLVLNLLAGPGPERLLKLDYFADDAPLIQHHLLSRLSETSPSEAPLLAQTLIPDPTLLDWLLGHDRPHPEIAAGTTLVAPTSSDKTAPLLCSPLIQTELEQIAQHHTPALIVFHGPDHTAQQTAARWLAQHRNQPLLGVDMTTLLAQDLNPSRALTLALRDARLLGALPYFSGWDACLDKDRSLPPALLTRLNQHPTPIILAGQTRWHTLSNPDQQLVFWLDFPVPAYEQRLLLWQHFAGETVVSEQLAVNGGQSAVSSSQLSVIGDQLSEDSDHLSMVDNQSPISALAGQFALTTGQIRDAVAAARGLAAQRGEELQMQDLFLAARSHSNPQLAALARKVTPRYGWSDIVLPEEPLTILREIVAAVRERPVVLEQWGVGRKLASSAAVTVLFAGDPGTGKTMAAEVMANDLNLDLYKIDLASIISKYIGETEKNLEKIFNEAERSNAILFFDEADSIFGKRSEVKDAHDRYANIEVSYLLQRMESYDGVTILATNLRANLDEAFTRRLQFVIDFPFPEPEDRLRIWQTLFPPDVPRTPNMDFSPLAENFELAGGNIRNVIVTAAYLAASNGRQVTMDHLVHGMRRELQKMGRLVEESELGFR